MKKLTRDRVVPIIFARVSWLILGITTSGFPSFAKEFALSENRYDRFFSLIGYDRQLDLPFPEVKHSIGLVALRKDQDGQATGGDKNKLLGPPKGPRSSHICAGLVYCSTSTRKSRIRHDKRAALPHVRVSMVRNAAHRHHRVLHRTLPRIRHHVAPARAPR
jgi:hypothetical protein